MMKLAAINPCSFLDYPGCIAAVFFTYACNMRCGYCHNASFVLPDRYASFEDSMIPFSIALDFLQKRKEKLEGVVFCGGEPTLQNTLIDSMHSVVDLGFKVKLDTNGSRFSVVYDAIEKRLIHACAVDFKTSFDRYASLTGIPGNYIQKTLEGIRDMGNLVDWYVRTTVFPSEHSFDVLDTMAMSFPKKLPWYWQKGRNTSVLNENPQQWVSFYDEEIFELKERIQKKHNISIVYE